jgi:hypothetical protein
MFRSLYRALGLGASMLLGAFVALGPLGPMHPGEHVGRNLEFTLFVAVVVIGGATLGAIVWKLATRPRQP